MARYCGFAEEAMDSVLITLDKMDKIGAEGVKAELTEKQLPDAAINALADFIAAGDVTLESVASRCADPAIADDLKYVLATAKAMANGRFDVAYCPSLVRGQGYYTGMVFEITCPQFSGAVAGGGRYDNMVGKFLGTQVPAVGFSIGFERVCGILLEQGYQTPRRKAEDRPAVRQGCRLHRRSCQGCRPAQQLQCHRSAAGQEAGQTVGPAGSFRFFRCRLYG